MMTDHHHSKNNKVTVQQFRDALKDNPKFTSRTENDLVGDDRLERFLIARDYDLQKAKTMYQDHLNWREENNLEKIRAQVKDLPYLVNSFPYSKELEEKGIGLHHVVIHGGRSRLNEIVHIEVMGMNKITHGDLSENDSKQFYEHYYGFFEKRSMVLDQASALEGRMVKSIQLREVSHLTLMPQGGAMSIAKKVLKSGLDQYPESSSNALFLNAPPLFAAIFAIVKAWLPADTKKKLRFYSGEELGTEVLKFVSAQVVVAIQRSIAGELGDTLSLELTSNSLQPIRYERDVEKSVGARSCGHYFIALHKDGTKVVSWTRINSAESPKSVVRAKILHVKIGQEHGIHADDVTIESHEISGESAKIPAGVTEALLMIILDNTQSWFSSHSFKLKLVGAN